MSQGEAVDPSRQAWGREEYQGAIADARSLASVFELANEGMSRRSEWGDGLRESAACALAWTGYRLPAFAGGAEVQVASESISAAGFKAVGLAAAKMAAAELLSHQFKSSDEADARREWSSFSSDVQFMVKDAASTAYEGATGRKPWSFPARALLGPMGDSRSPWSAAWEEAGHYSSFEQVSELLLRPQERTLAAEAPASRLAWDSASADGSQAEALLSEVGLGFIQCGPAGGMGNVQRNCSMLRSGYQELSRASGVPVDMLGLDIDGLQVNVRSGSATAFHSSPDRLMGFTHVAGHLGHEWTHLLDAATHRLGDRAQKEALLGVMDAIQNCPADPELGRRFAEMAKDELPPQALALWSAKPDFLRQAMLKDGRNAQSWDAGEDPGFERGYHASMKEMVARVGEGHWLQASGGRVPALAVADATDALPKGIEAAHLSQAYGKLIEAFAANPRVLQAPGKRAAGPSIEASSGLSERLLGEAPLPIKLSKWREGREAPAAPTPQKKPGMA